MSEKIYFSSVTVCTRGLECPVADRCWRADIRGDLQRYNLVWPPKAELGAKCPHFVARHQDGGSR